MMMPQRTPPMLPAPDLLQRKGCQAVLLPSRKMIYPFRTSLASCAPHRDDMLNMAMNLGWPQTPLRYVHSQAPASKNSISASWIS